MSSLQIQNAIIIKRYAEENGIGLRKACVECGFSERYFKEVKRLVGLGKFANISEEDKKYILGVDVVMEKHIQTNEGSSFSYIHNKPVSKEEGIVLFGIDLTKDEIVSWEVSMYQQGSKNEKKGIVVTPLYRIFFKLKPKAYTVKDIDFKSILNGIKPYKGADLKIDNTSNILLINISDLHLNKLEHTGLISYKEDVLDMVRGLMSDAYKVRDIERVVLVFLGDNFNVDNANLTTTAGTSQRTFMPYKEMVEYGIRLFAEMIDMVGNVLPVDVLFMQGNHDYNTSYCVGLALEQRYRDCAHINVNMQVKDAVFKGYRAYYKYGQSLLGFTHGNMAKASLKENLMPIEVPTLWAETKYRDYFIGHFHHSEVSKRTHKVENIEEVKEIQGVTLRIVRSPSVTDIWSNENGHCTSIAGIEGHIINKQNHIRFTLYDNI